MAEDLNQHLDQCPLAAVILESLGEELEEAIRTKLLSREARRIERPSVRHFYPSCFVVQGSLGEPSLYIGHGRRVSLEVCLKPAELSTLLGENWDLMSVNLHDGATCAWGGSCKHHGGLVEVLGVTLRMKESKLSMRFDVSMTHPAREIEKYASLACVARWHTTRTNNIGSAMRSEEARERLAAILKAQQESEPDE